jgi:two-component system, sensor histidine kinase
MISTALLFAIVLNVWIMPDNHVLSAPLYIAVLIAAHRFSTELIAVVGIAALALYLIIAVAVDKPTEIIPFGVASVVIVTYLAIQFSLQRETTRDQSRALETVNESLQRNQERLRLALSQAPIVVFNQDRDLRYTWVANPHQEFTEDSIVGKTEHDFFPAGEAEYLIQLKTQVMESGLGTRQEVQISPDGNTHTYDMTIEPMRDSRGKVSGIICSAIDITDRKRAEREREEILLREQLAHQRLQRFLAAVAHDLVQPLTTVLGLAQVLDRRVADRLDENEMRRLEAIDAAARRMYRLSQDLAQAAEIGAGHFSISRDSMDLVDVARQIVAEHQESTDRHHIILSAPEQVRGWWDRDRMNQLIGNLISNAIKYSPNGGDVRVDIRVLDDGIVLSVTDEGIGIPDDQRDDLFEPFSRLEAARQFAGSGLGLYICRGIVEAHGGQISVESTPDEGSVFSVVLPLEPGANASSTE